MFEFLFEKKNNLLSESIFGTWVASAVLFGVIGSTLTSRERVTQDVRQGIEILYLVLAMVVLIWACVSFFSLISFRTHRITLFFLILFILAIFAYTMYLMATSTI